MKRVGLGAAALAGCALKWHYSVARPEDLAWILGPTAWLTGLASGGAFDFESGIGWASRELRFIIVPSCAGVNFLVAAFWTLAWTTARERAGASTLHEALRLAGCGAAAYLAALVANTLRLTAAIAIHAQGPDWLAGAQAHRILGLVVYLPILFGLHHAAATTPAPSIPAACYLVVAVAVPIATGAAASPGFVEHALTVVAAVSCGCLAVVAVRGLRGSRRPRRMVRAPAGATVAANESAGEPGTPEHAL